jgi:hypothetical protein
MISSRSQVRFPVGDRFPGQCERRAKRGATAARARNRTRGSDASATVSVNFSVVGTPSSRRGQQATKGWSFPRLSRNLAPAGTITAIAATGYCAEATLFCRSRWPLEPSLHARAERRMCDLDAGQRHKLAEGDLLADFAAHDAAATL